MARRKINPWLKFGLEFGPVLAFFIGFSRFRDASFQIGATEYHGFILATALFVPLMALATLALWLLTGRLSVMQVLTLILVLVFGGLSLWFNDPRFFKMKPTIIYLMFAGMLGFGLLRGRSYLSLAMDEVLPLAEEGWMILTRRLVLFFLGLALANEVVWRSMSDQAWVNFKTFGLTGAIFLFFMSQARVIERHSLPADRNDPPA